MQGQGRTTICAATIVAIPLLLLAQAISNYSSQLALNHQCDIRALAAPKETLVPAPSTGKREEIEQRPSETTAQFRVHESVLRDNRFGYWDSSAVGNVSSLRFQLSSAVCGRRSFCDQIPLSDDGRAAIHPQAIRSLQQYVDETVNRSAIGKAGRRRLPLFPLYRILEKDVSSMPNRSLVTDDLQRYFGLKDPLRCQTPFYTDTMQLWRLIEEQNVDFLHPPYAGANPLNSDQKNSQVELPAFTEYAQRLIRRSQSVSNVRQCTTKKVFVYQMAKTGLGASLMLAVHALQHAMIMNRLLIMDKVWFRWTGRHGACADQGWECFFLPPSPCMHSMINEKASTVVTARELVLTGPWSTARILRRIFFRSPDLTVRDFPDLLPPGVNRSEIPRRLGISYERWAFNQLLRYLVRGVQPWLEETVLSQLDQTGFPWPEDEVVVAAHVRNGEKKKDLEAQNVLRCSRVDDSLPLTLVEALVTSLHGSNQTRNVSIFFSFDQPTILQESVNFWSKVNPQFTPAIRHAKFPMFNMKSFRGIEDARIVMSKIFGEGHVVKVSLVNLFLALTADAWANNDSSNWCKVINGLRFTAGTHLAPYTDLMELSSRYPPVMEAFCTHLSKRKVAG